jgi:hypothetical protein
MSREKIYDNKENVHLPRFCFGVAFFYKLHLPLKYV